MKQKDTKYCDFELKDIDEVKGIVAFYFSSFNTKDSDNDIIMPGAFSKTFSESKARVKHFRNHNPNEVPGTITELGVDEKGAFAVSKLALKTKVGLDTYEQYKEGIITEHSFGFEAIKAEPIGDGGRTIKEVKLWEVSSLTHWGSNENTPSMYVKSIDDIKSYMSKLTALLTTTKVSDEKAAEIIHEYEALGKVILTLKKAPLAVEKPVSAIDYDYLVNNFSL